MAVLDQIFVYLLSPYIAEIGGWWDTYSHTTHES